MEDMKARFLKRIGLTLDEHEPIAFEHVDRILEQATLTLPFENLCVVEQRTKPISRESLIEKVLVQKEGGLCYELNPTLYYFLLDAGFDVKLTRGAVFDTAAGAFTTTGRTHVAILLHHEGQTYLIDTGFGGNLPLKPVPLLTKLTADGSVTLTDSSFTQWIGAEMTKEPVDKASYQHYLTKYFA